MPALLSRQMTLDARGLRYAGTAMIGLASIWTLLPDGTGIPCPMRALTGVPCPMCGMTTSVVAAMHGDIQASIAANPLGVVAIICALALLVRPRINTLTLPVAIPVLMAGSVWIYELARVL